jgi:hypothetical protein
MWQYFLGRFTEGGVDCPPQPSHGCVWTHVTMHVQTKFLRLCKPVSMGDRIDDWRVCWLGGWDKCRVFFVVMVEREDKKPVESPDPKDAASLSVTFR